ncbi:MAG TPA: PRC-barrel domain-containing protein [Candidatus Dormibacteraeota bacterium]|nr:PRC-barrel domain-containing protein [Candidatus Dormibacteraeota bacterium]
MPHYGILRDHKMEDVDDLRGADVYGVDDEKLGTIDDVIFDHSSGDIRYIVLKTGGLLSRRKVMVPANRVEPYGNHDDKFYAELDKERLEMLPEFKEDTMKAQGDWSTYEKDYEKRWNDGAVMYNKNTGRIITAPHEEEVGPAIGSRSALASGRRLDLQPEKMGKEDDLLGVASGTGKTTLRPKKPSIGGKEDAEMLQREREQREIMNPTGEELEIQREEPGVRSEAIRSQAIGEPGIHKVDPVVETEQSAGPMERQDFDRGRRWIDFQQKLRSRREKIVVECPDCASQDKAA